jgi:hypothetical protein
VTAPDTGTAGHTRGRTEAHASTAFQYYWRRLPITIGEFDKR